MLKRKFRFELKLVYFGPRHLTSNNLKNSPPKWKIWVSAARLRTLPLAFSGTGLGNYLAVQSAGFQPKICILTFLTTLFLQVLSNFANDLGDSIHGADHAQRSGPSRAVQSGSLSPREMKTAVWVMALASLFSGIWLLWESFHQDWQKSIPLFLVGLLGIGAAYFYTNGKNPYGYMALGDVSVFVFFGLVAVAGSYYLHSLTLGPDLVLPSLALGFWSTAVLNINNMRDTESDQVAGKVTIPIILGPKKAVIYHSSLVWGGIFCFLSWPFNGHWFLVLLSAPGLFLILKSYIGVFQSHTSKEMDKQLKPQALGTFLSVLGLWIGHFFRF